MGDEYIIHTLNSSLEVLQIFGDSINSVFPDTEVLSLRNICGEGISLTHEEWDYMTSEIMYFPGELAHFLLEKDSILSYRAICLLVPIFEPLPTAPSLPEQNRCEKNHDPCFVSH